MRKHTQKGLEYQILVSEGKRQKLKSKLEQKSKEIDDLLYSTKNQITVEESMVQFNDIFKMFDSAQNQYLQLRDEEDGADTWFEDIDNWVFEYKHKIYNWLREAGRESAMSARRSNQSGKSSSSRSLKNSYSSSYSEKSRSIKAREIEERQILPNFERRSNSWNNGKEQKIKQNLSKFTRIYKASNQELRFTGAMMKSMLKKAQYHKQ